MFGRSYTATFEEEGGRVHEALCYDDRGARGEWKPSELSVGQVLRQPEPLFRKLDDGVVEEEQARIGAGSLSV